ncbi:hypothetical protein E1301_Tti019691 [Triplophysa tibetana]|uniref:Uncharacterized protein n=1 Tax=Triplophysa tibetana TaxID=1572043 RepID=A0A5A9ND95_9TELE|nr:hypothetical protein E1301_Tti019691 [Triplophysa tibetana]
MTKPSHPIPLPPSLSGSPSLALLLLAAFFFSAEKSRAGSDNSQALVSVEIREEQRTTVPAAGFVRREPQSTGRCGERTNTDTQYKSASQVSKLLNTYRPAILNAPRDGMEQVMRVWRTARQDLRVSSQGGTLQ